MFQNPQSQPEALDKMKRQQDDTIVVVVFVVIIIITITIQWVSSSLLSLPSLLSLLSLLSSLSSLSLLWIGIIISIIIVSTIILNIILSITIIFAVLSLILHIAIIFYMYIYIYDYIYIYINIIIYNIVCVCVRWWFTPIVIIPQRFCPCHDPSNHSSASSREVGQIETGTLPRWRDGQSLVVSRHQPGCFGTRKWPGNRHKHHEI